MPRCSHSRYVLYGAIPRAETKSDPNCPTLPDPVLITGAGGFIGSHLTELCVRQGLKVKAFVHYNAEGRWGWLEDSACRDDIEIVAGDIRDFDSVQGAMSGCRTVLHLAALIGIPYSYASPLAYLKTNVEGTYNVLQSARALDLAAIAIASTSETYGSAQYAPIDEKHPVSSQSPYAASKASADQLALSYHRSFGLPVRIFRPFNAYGPRQSARAFIPTVISQALAQDSVVRLGSLHPTRDYTYVEDVARGIVEIAACESCIGSATNIGSNDEVSMGDLARRILALLNSKAAIESDADRVRPEKSEVERLVCDNSKLAEATGWEPSWSLDAGLLETIDWIRRNLDRYKPDQYSV